MINKTTLARVLLPFMTAFFIVAPSQSYAVVPLVLRVTQSYLKTPAGQKAIGHVVGLALGTAVMVFGVERQDSNGLSRVDEFNFTDSPRQPTLNEESKGFTPGWPSVNPPLTTPLLTQYSWGATYPRYDSTSGACGAQCPGPSAQYPQTDCSLAAPMSCQHRTINTTTPWYYTPLYAYTSCPEGYSQSGSECTLSNPELVKSPIDRVCPITRNGNAYSADPRDPDCEDGSAPAFTTPSPGVSVWEWVGSGDGHRAQLTVNADGSMVFVEDIANPDGLTTDTTTVTADAPADNSDPPLVTGVSTVTKDGTGTETGAPVSTVSDPGTAAAIETGTADVVAALERNTAAVEAARQADADYRAGEQARFEERLGSPPLPDSISETIVPVSISSVLFSSNATCPDDIPLTVMGTAHSISFGPMCDVMIYLRPLFLAFGAFSCAFIFIGGLKS